MRCKNLAIVSTAALLLVGGYFVLLTPVEGQDQPPPDVFTPVDASGWVDPLLPDDAILRSRPVTVNMATLALVTPPNPNADPPAVPVRFSLFDDVSVTVVFHKAKPRYNIQIPDNPFDLLGQEFEPVGYTWNGDIVGNDGGHVTLVTGPNFCAAEINAVGVGSFSVRRSGDVHAVRELGRDGMFQCDVTAAQGTASAEGGGTCGIDFVGCDDGTVLDLLVVYTSAARLEAEDKGRDIEMEIRDFHFTDVNLALSNSQVGTEFRLVGVVELDYSGSVKQSEITDPWDGILDEIHDLRNALRADVVSVAVADSQIPGSGGASSMGDENPKRESYAFNHYLWTKGGGPDWVLTHETGHNLGCSHNRQVLCPCDGCPGCAQQSCIFSCPNCENNCDCDHGTCDYSYGYLLPPETPLYNTLMSWEGPGGTEGIRHFSNPDVLYPRTPPNYPTGVAIADPGCNSADNAGTIDETRDTVANYRESCNTTDTTNIASHDYFIGQSDGDSFSVSISANGQYIAFASDATTDWIPWGQDGFRDIYLFNRESGLARWITSHVQGTGGDSFSPAISGNGQFVAFASYADNLSNIDENPDAESEIYVSSHAFGGIPGMRRVSIDSAGLLPNGDSFSPSISFNGRYVAFDSAADNLVAGDTPAGGGGYVDIFLRDRDGNEDLIFDEVADSTTTRVSLTSLGLEANGASINSAISTDGQFVAFESDADNLLDDPTQLPDTNTFRDIFVRDTLVETTSRVSVSTADDEADDDSFAPSISATGRFVAFESDATNLVEDDTLGHRDIFVRDTAAPVLTSRVSVASDGTEANGDSFAPVISANGRFVAFHSDATNLLGAGADQNGLTDVFVHDLTTGETIRVSINSLEGEATGGPSSSPAISDDGRFIGFESDATNLIGVCVQGESGDCGGFRDIFFRDRGSMCVGDLNGDFVVDPIDLAMLLGFWGPVDPCPPYVKPDLDFDCEVGPGDLAILLGNWGPCL